MKSISNNGRSGMVLRITLSRETIAELIGGSNLTTYFQVNSSTEDDNGFSETYAEAVSRGSRRSSDSFAFLVLCGAAKVVGEDVGENGLQFPTVLSPVGKTWLTETIVTASSTTRIRHGRDCAELRHRNDRLCHERPAF